MDFMSGALSGTPQKGFRIPSGIVPAKIDPATGHAVPDDAEGITEYFYQENMPALDDSSTPIIEETPMDGTAI
jgi:penicillin-binding protein 1A